MGPLPSNISRPWLHCCCFHFWKTGIFNPATRFILYWRNTRKAVYSSHILLHKTVIFLKNLHIQNNFQNLLSKSYTAEQNLSNGVTFKDPSLKAYFVSAYPQYWQWTLVRPADFPITAQLFATWHWALVHPSGEEVPSNCETEHRPRDPLHISANTLEQHTGSLFS